MHVTIELAVGLMTSRYRAVVASIADGIPATICLPTRKAPRQIPKSIQLLAVKSSIMPCHTMIVRTCPSEVITIAKFHMSKPRVDRFQGFDRWINSLSGAVSIDDWLRPASKGSMLDVAEYGLK